MRVISGDAKGRKLKAPAGLETRPTSELCKEAVFSIIQFEIAGARVLDLFAGSGQMGIEALSRGAKSCVFVDNAKICRSIIAENLKSTNLEGNARVMSVNAEAFLKSQTERIDIAFLDPPYGKVALEPLLNNLAAIMSENGVILCESDKKDMLPEYAGAFPKYKEYRYGKTKITVYRGDAEDQNGDKI